MHTLRTYNDQIEAGVALSVLEGNGISAFIADEAVASIDPRLGFAGGIRLMVDDADAQQAAEVLKEFYDDQGESSVDRNSDIVADTNISVEIVKFGSKFLLHVFLIFIGVFSLLLIALTLMNNHGGK